MLILAIVYYYSNLNVIDTKKKRRTPILIHPFTYSEIIIRISSSLL